jgi:hypothetical protein
MDCFCEKSDNSTLILTVGKPQPNSQLLAEKSHYYLDPCRGLWERGKRGAFSAALKIFRIKT